METKISDIAVKAKVSIVNSSHLTSECWLVQFRGLSYCETCDLKDTDDCGGQKIRETGENRSGFKVPIGRRIK